MVTAAACGDGSGNLPATVQEACAALGNAPAVTPQKALAAKGQLSAKLADTPNVTRIGVSQCGGRPVIAVGVSEEVPAEDRVSEVDGVPVVWHRAQVARGQ
ncbi:hypothetical protein EV193_10245 [Herbihabitans rhizosphaerae]|uniref:Uncharacterized protein n=2 Tax=Herbihabitans rhizosphaerae TaxID=1872711 RepID=A0A4Q7L0S8_9PSEU|nr:hypothetical protein EV193_10245 [Herbihabitans rhizosphaerae]